ncbi:hypothetical protein GCM10010329_05390 [Streptomyces spiroverticillatus]|uniref:MmpS family membrane protein n=1 Tax=Streptomyces finlayi TaxID=67296 RepID=A0A918WSY9_9ACTN|nr:hypothetical protein [Streptomyces finlayi]GGZ88215.1 hypothetical protein GCM10010329_05390 [Streptomyces spiroverticillatus]GHC79266.1 hypothetical protein GCM10010334_05370 [Streptomyces finlayi]
MTRTTRTARTALCAAAVAGLFLGLTACQEAKDAAKSVASEGTDKAIDQVDKAVKDTYEVTYEVSGSGINQIGYHAGKGTALEPLLTKDTKPKLPWTKTVTLKGIMPPAVVPTTMELNASPDLKCKVLHKGKVLAEATGDKVLTGGCIAAAPVGK